MKPTGPSDTQQLDLFRASLRQILNPAHPLLILAAKIDWTRFDAAFAECYSPDMGAPAKAVRLMVGLHDLKHAFNESDESLLEKWVENPYWQAFCGFDVMQHEAPLHPTSLVKWRQRVGAERLTLLLEETIARAVAEKEISPRELKQVTIDTTVQEKNITHPTDSKRYHRAITKLAKAAKDRGVPLRQTYIRVAKKAAVRVSRYAHARQFKRMRRQLKKMRTWLGRVIRDMRRQVDHPDPKLDALLERCERLHAQQPTDSNKLYSLHEPDVKCISKARLTNATSSVRRFRSPPRTGATGSSARSCAGGILTMATRWPKRSPRSNRTPASRSPTPTSTKGIADTTTKQRRRSTSPAVRIATGHAPGRNGSDVAAPWNRRSATSNARTGSVAASWRG